MSVKRPDNSCEAKEAAERARQKENFCDFEESTPSLDTLLLEFFEARSSSDPKDYKSGAVKYLFDTDVCDPTNWREEICVPVVDPDDPDCCSTEKKRTYCPDDGCPTKLVGWGYNELVRAAMVAESTGYIPRAGEPVAGEVLVWDPEATPDNEHCDPCYVHDGGAWVPGSGSPVPSDLDEVELCDIADLPAVVIMEVDRGNGPEVLRVSLPCASQVTGIIS